MKYLILFSLLSFSLFASSNKVTEKRKSFKLNNALIGTSITPKEFFEEFKKVASHQFEKDPKDINYIMLNDFLTGIQDKKVIDHDVIISVKPNKEYNRIRFHMYMRPAPNEKIDHYKFIMHYKQDTSKENLVKTIIDFKHGPVKETAIKFMSAMGELKQAVPIKEVIKMFYNPENEEITYQIYMKTFLPVTPEELDKTFDDAFEKIQKIAAEKVVPAIENRLY